MVSILVLVVQVHYTIGQQKMAVLRKGIFKLQNTAQPRPQGAFPWLWEKRPGDEVEQCNKVKVKVNLIQAGQRYQPLDGIKSGPALQYLSFVLFIDHVQPLFYLSPTRETHESRKVTTRVAEGQHHRQPVNRLSVWGKKQGGKGRNLDEFNFQNCFYLSQ